MRIPVRIRLTALVTLCLAGLPLFAAINGTIMTPEGTPIAGARVSIRPFENQEARNARLLSASPEVVPLASTQTDAKGNFSLESPKEAVVLLAVSARGYQPEGRSIERDEEAGAIMLSAAEVRSGRIASAGKPVSGAVVVLRFDGFDHVVKTDAEGRYEAPDPKRARGITVIHPDFALDEKNFLVPAGGAVSDLTRTLTPGVAITGKVVAADGETAVAGATILLDGWPLAKSGEEGTFTIPRTQSRWTTLLARKDGLLAQRPFAKDATYTLRMAKAAMVTGRVTDGKTKLPVAGTVVYAGPRRMGRIGGDPGTSAITDAKGAYSLALPAGTYGLMAVHPAYPEASADVAVTAGQQATKDFSPSPLARISGVVVDEGKKPVVAAILATEDAQTQSMGGAMRFLRGGGDSTASGPDGRFSLRAETESALWVRAVKRGMPAAKSDSLQLGPGERKSGVVIMLPSGIAVSGRATDKEGNPLSGVAVSAMEAEPRGGGMNRMIFGGMPGRDDDAVHTGSDGSFTMRVKEGTYDFGFRREGYATKVVRGQVVSNTLSPSVEASLEPAVEVAGRVVRAGAGIENARVMAFSSDTSTATTSADGSFTLTGVAPGSIRLMVRKEDEFVNEMRTVEAPARDVVIEVRPGGNVSGRVVEKGSSKPVTIFQAGITTSSSGGGMVRMGPPQLRDFNSDDGTFTLDNVPTGAVVLVVNAPGYAPGRVNLTVEEGKSITGTEVQLDTGVKLTGRVTGPNGSGVSDVSVRVMPSATGGFGVSSMDRSTTTDSNGEYTFEALEPGEETLTFNHAKYVSARKQVTLKGRETRFDVQLNSGQKITGTVMTESGALVAEADVQVSGSGRGDRARTNANGAFEIEGLPSGRYRFSASKTGYAEGIVDDFDVSSGAPVRITLKTGGTIYGHVSGVSERELAQAEVDASSGRERSSGSIDSAGNYRIEGAPIGTVQVTARVMTGNGYRSSSAQSVQVSPGSSQQVDIVFRGDTVIRGRVSRNGTPLISGQVTFVPRGSTADTVSSSATDEQGMYSVNGLDEGDYTVQVVDSQRSSPYATQYTVRGSGTFDIDYRTAALRGRVTDVASNEAIPNVNVQLRPVSTPGEAAYMGYMMTRNGATDANGAFVLDAIPPGSYSLTATKEGFGIQALDVTVGSSPVDNLDLKLAKNDGSTIKVVDARDGQPVRATATVFDGQGRLVHELRSSFFGSGGSDTGELKVPVGPGTYMVYVTAGGYAGRNISFQSPATLTVQLTPGGTLVVRSKHSDRRRVRLIDASGLPYPRTGMSTGVRDLNPRPGASPMPHIAPGSYTIQLLGDQDIVVDSKQVVVQEGQTTEAEI
ncbi:MAG TPA: carboxypeptidase regulatory-like domain-containing protein [Thermoanaerobaculia bacterium]|nr:carboxypeptidase regulatory-like domain-containing protein [Thermoanaerobaculia bacterium]